MDNNNSSAQQNSSAKDEKKKSPRQNPAAAGSGGPSSRGRGNNGRNGSSRNGPQRNGATRQERAANISQKVDMKKYDRMISAAHNNFSDIPCGPNTEDCVICCKPNDVFGIGACRHPVCAECSIRIRILGDSKVCPVCRGNIETLYFCTVDDDFATITLDFPKTSHPHEDRFSVRFSSSTSGEKYERYLAHVCKICKSDDGERLEFPTYISLRQHMANNHQLSYCHICTENLNLFSRERKSYTRDQLSRHTRIGDYDDRSFKGHPQCLFCEQKFLDEENRYKHLRKDHFFCQFCEADGSMTNVFFGKHDELKAHYKQHHFPCQTTECLEMGIAFATKLELDLHKANEHSDGRRNVLDIAFGRGRREVHLGAQRGRRQPDDPAPPPPPNTRIAVVQRDNVAVNPQSDPSQFTVVPSAQSRNPSRYVTRPAYTPQTQDFPSLAPAPPPPPVLKSNDFPRLKKPKQNEATPATPVEEFPSLGGTSSSGPSRVSVPPIVRKPVVAKVAIQKQQPKKGGKKDRKPIVDEEEYAPPRDVPQALIKVNNTMLRFDMVDNSSRPTAKSNIQLISRSDVQAQQSSGSSSSSLSSRPQSGRMDFPSLPAASAPIAPANTAWLNSKNSRVKSSITGVTVPSNYSNATKGKNQKNNKKVKTPVNEVWSSLGRPPTPPEPTANDDEWKDVPLSKEAQIEQEKKAKKEWARKRAEIRAAVEASSKAKKLEEQRTSETVEQLPITDTIDESSSSSSRTSSVEEEWKEIKNSKNANNNEKKKNKKNKKNNDESATDGKNLEEKEKEPEPDSEKKGSVEESNQALKSTLDAIWNLPAMPTVTTMFSNFSLSMFGGATAKPADQSPTTSIAPPPGLENVVVKPPPGFGNEKIIDFKSAPYLSHEDLQAKNRKEVVEEPSGDGWVTTGKNKNKKKQKK